ncbi:hypothetical protein CMV_027902, partial [Castanea mollissima]
PSVAMSDVPSNTTCDVSNLVTSSSPIFVAPTDPMPQSSLPLTHYYLRDEGDSVDVDIDLAKELDVWGSRDKTHKNRAAVEES